MKLIAPTIAGFSINAINAHMLMVLNFVLPPGPEYKVQATADFKTWTVLQTLPASQVQQQINYSLDLTMGQAIFVTYQ